MDPRRSSAEPGPETVSSRFQLAARRAQGQMTDAAWWQLGAQERVRTIYEALRHLDGTPADDAESAGPAPEIRGSAGAVTPD